jgi:hypothetical protein
MSTNTSTQSQSGVDTTSARNNKTAVIAYIGGYDRKYPSARYTVQPDDLNDFDRSSRDTTSFDHTKDCDDQGSPNWNNTDAAKSLSVVGLFVAAGAAAILSRK